MNRIKLQKLGTYTGAQKRLKMGFVFVIAQAAMKMISVMMGEMAIQPGNMFLMIPGSMIGHIMYGIDVVLSLKEMKSVAAKK